MKCITLNVTPATVETAFAKAQAIFEKRGDHEITMSFSGGNYTLSSPIVLDAAAYPGQSHLRMLGGSRIKTVFSALKSLPADAFRPVEGKPYYVCQLEKQADGTYPNLRAIYANHKIVDVSRTGEYRSTAPFTKDGVTYAPTQEQFRNTHMIYVPMAAIDEAGLENCIGAEVHIRVEWEFKIYHIAKIDTDDTYTDDNGALHVAMYLPTEEVDGGNGVLSMCNRVFFICNTTSVLTTPGQYTYERAIGKLYYYPTGCIADCSFGISEQTSLFSFCNFDSLTLRGLTFTGIEDDILTRTGYYAAGQAGSWNGRFEHIFPHAGALKIENVGEADINGCTFTDLPCDGLSMVGVLDNITVQNCRFTNIGATAIRVGRPKPYSDTDRINNLRITNNYLDNIGFTYENSCSILVTKVKDGKLNRNTVLRSSYTAFSLGWKWDVANWAYGEEVNLEDVEVAYNYIRSFVMNMRDGGGIYTLGGNVCVDHAPFMNTLHDNYVIEDELTCPENGFFGSLYHDGASSNWHTYNNIVVHHPALCGVYPHYSGRIYLQRASAPSGIGSTLGQAAWHILCENNYICGCKNFGEIFRSQHNDPVHAADMLDASRDLREINTHMLKSAKELKQYPDAVRIIHECGCSPDIGKYRK